MKPLVRTTLLVTVECFLGFILVCVLPFAWIMRDGLGPDSVTTTGLAALGRTLTSFYIGPVLLLLILGDVWIRTRPVEKVATDEPVGAKRGWVIVVVALVVLVVLSMGMGWALMG